MENILKEIINSKTGNDFVDFEIKHIEAISIDKKYPGLAAILEAKIKNTRTPLKIDFGFGDIVYTKALVREIPTQLPDFPPPTVKTYSVEKTFAEKLDAILSLMEFSSRMKDYYDIYFLSLKFSFEGEALRIALTKTFKTRERTYHIEDLQRVIELDSNEAMHKKWKAFIKKTHLPALDFSEVLAGINAFIEPIWVTIATDDAFILNWDCQQAAWNKFTEYQ